MIINGYINDYVHDYIRYCSQFEFELADSPVKVEMVSVQGAVKGGVLPMCESERRQHRANVEKERRIARLLEVRQQQRAISLARRVKARTAHQHAVDAKVHALEREYNADKGAMVERMQQAAAARLAKVGLAQVISKLSHSNMIGMYFTTKHCARVP